jgi:drug/metabolite transporter (DMT)-like permease
MTSAAARPDPTALSGRARLAGLTGLALFAFAANSLLCRLAIGGGWIDPASFTSVRVVSGAAALLAASRLQGRRPLVQRPPWRSAAALTVYMVAFAAAYVSLSAGTGALILFGAVQLTMFAAGLIAGERLSAAAWCGLVLALAGLVYLVLPGLAAPPPLAAALMLAAGAAWGAYSLLGRRAADPLAASAASFAFSAPAVLGLALVAHRTMHVSPTGVALALGSGVLASGCGYVAWYAALRGLTPARAATIQLCVPVIAAAGAVLLLGEPMTPRLVIAGSSVLGGVAVALWRPRRPA